MRKFLLFIRRSWTFILFVFLEVLSVYFIAKNQSIQGLDIINSANSIAGIVYEKQKDISYYFNLKEANQELLNENQTLRRKLLLDKSFDTFNTVSVRIPIVDYGKKNEIPDTTKKTVANPLAITFEREMPIKVVRYAEYSLVPARVINNSVSSDLVNYITINRGTNSGIKSGMAVISSTGVVGRVENVSSHFATVASVLSNRKISARMTLHQSFGQITWQPGNPTEVQMENMPITLPVHYQDSVFTTGYSYFPPNVLIGTVNGIDTNQRNNSVTLQIRLATNFRTLKFVYVVKNPLEKEKNRLEAKNETAD